MLLQILFVLFLIIILYSFISKHYSLPILGIYRVKGKFYYIKFVYIYIILFSRKWFVKIKQQTKKISERHLQHDELERPQTLSTNKHAVDAVYFNASYEDKSTLIIATARRQNKLVNGLFYLRVPKFSDRLLLSPRLPDTCMKQDTEELGTYEVECIKITPLVPMKAWRIKYDGNMKFEDDHEEIINVKLDVTFRTNLPHFNYDTDMNPYAYAKAIAKEEPWSREYFDLLKLFHQTHYEQYGDIEGYAEINSKMYPLHLNAFRDHSFGEIRDWKIFHRYVMHFFSLENGDRITVGLVSMPVMLSEIELGFITKAKEKKNYPISEIDIKLYQFGENGKPPTDYAFSFKAGGNMYTVQVKVNSSPEFYLGEEAECRIVEQLCSFEVTGINGTINGWGTAEWQYRNLNGLPTQ